jgi:hypothetical protein
LQTGYTIILTGFTTWWNRTLASVDEDNVRTAHFGTGGGDIFTPTGRVWASLCDYEFERVCCDEAHTLRNPQTLVAEGVKQTQCLYVHFLSATIVVNHPKDLRGPLSMRFNPHHMLYDAQVGFLECYQDDFDPTSFTTEEQANRPARTINMLPPEKHGEAHAAWTSAIQTGEKIWLLDPENYRVCGNLYNWGPVVTSVIIPPILKMVMLRVTTASCIDLEDGKPPRRIGEDVPPCRIYSICLGMSKAETRMYRDRTQHLFKQLYVGDTDMVAANAPPKTIQPTIKEKNSDVTEGLKDAGVHRYLMHSTLDPRLAALTVRNHKMMGAQEKRAGTKLRRNNWVDVDFDNGASFYFVKTRHGKEYAIPADRLALATYMSALSVKIRFVIWLMSEWVVKDKVKAILVFEFPMPQW